MNMASVRRAGPDPVARFEPGSRPVAGPSNVFPDANFGAFRLTEPGTEAYIRCLGAPSVHGAMARL